MQSRACLALSGFEKLGNLEADDRDDRKHQGGIDAERPENDVVRRDDRGQAVQDQEGRDARQESGSDDAEAQPESAETLPRLCEARFDLRLEAFHHELIATLLPSRIGGC